MRILIVGDPHISHKRLERSQQFLDELANIINKSGVQATVILGDVFDEHEWVHVTCATAWHKFLQATKDEQIIHILGNHEMINAHDYPATMHALQQFKTYPNYQIIDKPTNIGIGFAAVPFVPVGKFEEAIDGLEGNVMFCHQEFAGSVSEKGDACPDSKWKVISGHIHEPMTIRNVWYPGSPLQHSFGEEDNKAIYIIDTEGTDYRIEQKITLNLKRFKTVPVAWDTTELPADLNTEDYYYRFSVSAKKTEMALFKASQIYKSLMSIGKVKMDVIQEERKQKQTQGVTFRSALSALLETEDLKEIAHEVGA